MSKQLVRCVDIEVALMQEFNYRQNLIVPNVSDQMGLVAFETDMIVLTKAGYAHGFEIKTSKADLKADFKKKQHVQFGVMKNGKTGLERFYSRFKYFSYAVPESLKECTLEIVPEFCGVWVYKDYNKFYQAKAPKKLFDYKWSDKLRYELARLGAMRIYSLKSAQRSWAAERHKLTSKPTGENT